MHALLIINRAGGLIYNRTFQPGLATLNTNDYLMLAGTFHGVHAITRSLTPAAVLSSSLLAAPAPATSTSGASVPAPKPQASGLEMLESALFTLTCFQTVSGTKFLLFAEPGQAGVEAVVARVYELWADYVMKNPFYSLENPVRCEAFERHLSAYLRAK